MGTKPSLTLVAHPQAYFHELLTEAMGSQKISTQPETEFYLVNLLNQFMTTDKLFPRDPDGNIRQEPLALMLKEALEQSQPRAQNALLRQIGDVSLYIAGYFQDSLNRKLVDVDYYIDMGGAAYQQVAAKVTEEDVLKSVYLELSEKFASLVEVLAAVGDKTTNKTEKNLLRLYDLWLKTRSERAAKALQEAGILPNRNIKKDYQ